MPQTFANFFQPISFLLCHYLFIKLLSSQPHLYLVLSLQSLLSFPLRYPHSDLFNAFSGSWWTWRGLLLLFFKTVHLSLHAAWLNFSNSQRCCFLPSRDLSTQSPRPIKKGQDTPSPGTVGFCTQEPSPLTSHVAASLRAHKNSKCRVAKSVWWSPSVFVFQRHWKLFSQLRKKLGLARGATQSSTQWSHRNNATKSRFLQPGISGAQNQATLCPVINLSFIPESFPPCDEILDGN